MNFMASSEVRNALERAMSQIMREQFHALPERSVSWRPERVDRMIGEFSHGPSESRAYAALVSPQDFMETSSTAPQIQRILGETGPLDMGRLSRMENKDYPLETPYLGVNDEADPDAILGLSQALRVFNHQGRHRTTALGRAGARQLPTILARGGHWIKGGAIDQYANLVGSPQRRLLRDRGLVDPAMGDGYAHNLIPIRPENRDALLALGTHNRTKNHITYALPLLAALASQLRSGDQETA